VSQCVEVAIVVQERDGVLRHSGSQTVVRAARREAFLPARNAWFGGARGGLDGMDRQEKWQAAQVPLKLDETLGRCRTSERFLYRKMRALPHTDWRVRGPGGTAELLGIAPTTPDPRFSGPEVRRHDSDTS
jgi:hypothetical protein